MAESPMNIGTGAPEEEEMVRVDCVDGDDVSSGSDRSLDEGDGSVTKVDPAGVGRHTQVGSVRSRRKRQGSHGSRRHKGGSRHKHKGYLPYSIHDDEFQLKRKSLELLEKENATAILRHEGVSEQLVTFPVAPFNSTQFLMDEHCDGLPAEEASKSSSSSLNPCSPQVRLRSVPSTPAESNHDTITFEKKDKEFTDFFTTAHAESLQSLPKDELVKHYINLEEKIAALQKKVAENQQRQDNEDLYSKFNHLDKTCDSLCNSDASSLSSSNEEFVDLSTVNQPSICVHDCSNSDSYLSSRDIKADSANDVS